RAARRPAPTAADGAPLMTRWLWLLVGALVVLGAAYFAFLNPDGVELHLTPGRTTSLPLAAALLGAFAAGGVLVGSFAGVRAGARGWRRWRPARPAGRRGPLAGATVRLHALVGARVFGR